MENKEESLSTKYLKISPIFIDMMEKKDGSFYVPCVLLCENLDRVDGDGTFLYVQNKKLLIEEVQRYNNESVKKNHALCELDPSFEREYVDLLRGFVSHIIKEMYWFNNNLYGVIKILKSTFSGGIVLDLINDNYDSLGISCRYFNDRIVSFDIVTNNYEDSSSYPTLRIIDFNEYNKYNNLTSYLRSKKIGDICDE